ncbi:MAG: DMT family transporter [Bacteroidales bacterium]
MNSKKRILTGIIAISISAILWGFDGVVLTPRLFDLDVSFVVFMLHIIPFAIMNLFFYKEYKNLKKFNTVDWITVISIALFGGAIGTLSIVKALFLVNFQHLSFVVLLQKLQPIFAIGLAAIILKEKLHKSFLLWAGLAIVAGYFLTFGFEAPTFTVNQNTHKAVLFALLAAFSFGSSTVFSKLILKKYDFKTATFFRYGITSLIMLFIVSFNQKWEQFQVVQTRHLILFLIIGLTSGSGAIFLYYFGLKKVKAIIATICELLFPLSAIFFDFFVNNNSLNTIQWISAIIMVYSIIQLNVNNTKKIQQKNKQLSFTKTNKAVQK